MGKNLVEEAAVEPTEPTEWTVAETEEERLARKAARKAAKKEAKKRALELLSDEMEPAEPPTKKKHSCVLPVSPTSTTSSSSSSSSILSSDFAADDSNPEEKRAAHFTKHRITIAGSGSEAFFPAYSFEEVRFPEGAQSLLSKFTAPTPIQSVCWPVILAKRDLIGVAETGSGKTLAFALPSLKHILSATTSEPKVLVLAPTRELIMQTAQVYEQLNASVACLYGGVEKETQIKQLRMGCDVIAATPGRLIDLVDSGWCLLGGVTYLVLDEADRMLDTGFEQPIRTIVGMVNPKRQALFLTATWPQSVQKLANEFLSNPITITIGSTQIAANVRVTQLFETVQDMRQKDPRLMAVMKKYASSPNARVLVFVLYKVDAPRVEKMLLQAGYNVGALHGNSNQRQRTEILDNFRAGRIKVLVATDVASRGLDVDDIDCVINYSLPLTIEDYVHRIGRTARAGKTGVSFSFFCHQHDRTLGWHLARILREAGQEVPDNLAAYPPPAIKQKGPNDFPTCNISKIQPAAKVRFDDDDD